MLSCRMTGLASCGAGWPWPAVAGETLAEKECDAALIKVRPRGNESIQQMLKRFKRLCQREGLTRDIKRHSYYEKPSERKRRQSRKLQRKVEREDVPRPTR